MIKPRNKVWFEEGSHSYYADEARTQLLPYYSGIIKEVLGDKFANVPSDVLENARIRGTEVHRATQMLDEGKSFTTDFPGHVEQWERFKLDFGMSNKKFDLIEQPLFCKELWFGITPDRIYKNTLVEIKTSCQSYPEYRLQTAAQALAILENFGVKIEKRMLVFLTDSTYRTEIHAGIKDFEAWKAVNKVFQWKTFNK